MLYINLSGGCRISLLSPGTMRCRCEPGMSLSAPEGDEPGLHGQSYLSAVSSGVKIHSMCHPQWQDRHRDALPGLSSLSISRKSRGSR